MPTKGNRHSSKKAVLMDDRNRDRSDKKKKTHPSLYPIVRRRKEKRRVIEAATGREGTKKK